MNFDEFDTRARNVFRDIPAEYREGVEGLIVEEASIPHPQLPNVYTLGECRSEMGGSDVGGTGIVRSVVHLFYGSFAALAERDSDWDWNEQIWETITHEIRHHIEHGAAEDDLEALDYAEDQNFARRQGKAFDPLFYRVGEDIEEGMWEVDGDLFIEQRSGGGRGGEVRLRGHRYRFPLPGAPGDVHFLSLEGVSGATGDVCVVLLRERGALDTLKSLFRRAPPAVSASTERAREQSG